MPLNLTVIIVAILAVSMANAAEPSRHHVILYKPIKTVIYSKICFHSFYVFSCQPFFLFLKDFEIFNAMIRWYNDLATINIKLTCI